ncbi:MAG TPA: class I SAM-dependent methyltransferase [Beijerinckiaceae bacterium]|nr:class I SAM-dependent methyltransferase [Beijerinckiaceae bacterium]
MKGPERTDNGRRRGTMRDAIAELILRMRKGAPSGIRRAYRLARHLTTPVRPSPPIPPELVRDCRVAASRLDLLAALPKGGRVVEIGTDRGDFARAILDEVGPEELHLLDLDFSQLRQDVARDPRVILHQGDSVAQVAALPDAAFDWIYVDADHSYEGVCRDAAAAAPKVKPGGLLVFNDFAHVDPGFGTYGVHRALTEFAVARRWPVAWFAFEVHGLYDIALRRPASG